MNAHAEPLTRPWTCHFVAGLLFYGIAFRRATGWARSRHRHAIADRDSRAPGSWTCRLVS
jgi:hypothetical protein